MKRTLSSALFAYTEIRRETIEENRRISSSWGYFLPKHAHISMVSYRQGWQRPLGKLSWPIFVSPECTWSLNIFLDAFTLLTWIRSVLRIGDLQSVPATRYNPLARFIFVFIRVTKPSLFIIIVLYSASLASEILKFPNLSVSPLNNRCNNNRSGNSMPFVDGNLFSYILNQVAVCYRLTTTRKCRIPIFFVEKMAPLPRIVPLALPFLVWKYCTSKRRSVTLASSFAPCCSVLSCVHLTRYAFIFLLLSLLTICLYTCI